MILAHFIIHEEFQQEAIAGLQEQDSLESLGIIWRLLECRYLHLLILDHHLLLQLSISEWISLHLSRLTSLTPDDLSGCLLLDLLLIRIEELRVSVVPIQRATEGTVRRQTLEDFTLLNQRIIKDFLLG